MRVPLSWLREYVAIPVPTAELAARLAVSTCEVERISHRGVPDVNGNLSLYRVGRVLEAGKHPNADRLQLCRVDVGEPEPRQIVCGAWNFGAGATVAVALPGAVLPGGQTLERAKLRGAVSDGMILSERELEIGQDHTGILVLTDSHEPGTPLVDVLPIGEEVLEVEVTGNRPDLLAVYGIAREIAALYDVELAPPPGRDPERAGEESVEIRIEDFDGCPVYMGRLFRDVRIGPSPAWLKARITAAGMRPISNVVDVTNYVMLALGNPTHVFDQATLQEGRIVVRRARPGETIRTLDGEERRLDPRDLLIADAERPVAIAGIMGGEETEVTDGTTEVLLEVANFEPVGILQSSERLRLRTEGSNRWEKGVDPYLAEQASRLATELIVALTGARWAGEADVRGELPERPVIRLRPDRINALIGVEVEESAQSGILQRLGFEPADGSVTVPTWRARDVTREVDLVEEIARFELDAVPFTLPERHELFGRLTKEQRLRRVVEDILVGCGFSEAYTPSLVSKEGEPNALTLPEPLSAEHAALRTRIVPSLVEGVRHNLDAGNEKIALFEIARVYLPSGEQLPDERWRVAGLVEGGFFQAKGAVETLYAGLGIELELERGEEPLLHPGKAARTAAGLLGELHPTALEGRWGAFELDLAVLFEQVPERVEYEDVVTYPPVKQDLAFVVDVDLPAGKLFEAARAAAGPELRDVRFLSDYREPPIPAGKKSIAFRVVFQSPVRTLSDEDAARLRERIVSAVAESFGGELRA